MLSLGIGVVFVISLSLSLWFRKLIPFFLKLNKWHVLDNQLIHYPLHWLFGNLQQVKSVKQFMDKSLEFVNNGAKSYLFWVGFYRPVVVVVHNDSVKTILRTSEPKARAGGAYDFIVPWLGEGLLVTSGKRWERNRRLLTPAFHFDVLQPYMKIYNHVTDILLKKLMRDGANEQSIEVFSPIGLVTLDTMLQCALSYNDDIQDKGQSHPYVQAVTKMSKLLVRRALTIHLYPDFIYYRTSDGKLFKKLIDYVHVFSKNVISNRKAALTSDPDQLKKRHLDFLDILLSARDELGTGLKDEEIQAEVDTFMFEGHDTTSSAITWSLWALAKYPEEQQKVLEDVKQVLGNRTEVKWDDLGSFHYLPLFIKEVMRLYPPVPLISRELSQDMVIDGVNIPKGVIIDINLYQTHRNETIWPDAEVFNPNRFHPDVCAGRDPYCFVPFSAGPRNCIGQNFALHEIKVVLSKVVQRFQIDLDESLPAIPICEVVMRAENGVHLKFTPRKATSA